jgi:hypothetical protein
MTQWVPARTATPGISIGYWKARKTPRAARSSGFIGEQILAVEQHFARGHLVVRLAGEQGERRLARAVRAHDGMDLPLLDREIETVEDLLAVDLDVQVFDFKQRHRFLFPVDPSS